MRIRVNYELLKACYALYDKFLLDAMVKVGENAELGFSTAGWDRMSNSPLHKHIIFEEVEKDESLIDWLRSAIENPQMICYFVRNKSGMTLDAFICIIQLNYEPAIQGIKVLPLNSHARKIYGANLQECLKKILANYKTGSFSLHAKDRAVADIQSVISSLGGITVSIGEEVVCYFNKDVPLCGVAAYKNDPSADMMVNVFEEQNVHCLKEAMDSF